MDLESSLRSIRSLSDLPRLVAELGHKPLWEEVPDQAWIRMPHRELEITAVGQTGEFPWFAVASSTPERDAITLARRISRRGRVGAVFALHPAAHSLVISVAFERAPHLTFDLADPDPEALASLSRLALVPEGGSLAFAAMAADALSAETVGHRFFREFRLTLDRMAAGLPGPMHSDDRHGLALLQLTRVLFLYFIQSKGWLAGRERFLAQEVDKCLSRHRRIHRDLLRPLFFGTLNRPRPERSRTATGLGSIPFLNGGLFEPHVLERGFQADIPNHLWRDAFDRLFERFHFTVVEGDRRGGVAPDMLGRVFEGVMAPDARRASGTFYTPAALVERLLDAALVPLLAGRLRCRESEAELRIRDGDGAAAGVLSSLTVLDPAVGSGAFLLGALDRLAAAGPPAFDAAARKRRVLQHNLFGVDLNTAAVRLTELRLWLAVVADDPADRAEAVSPLPNLDCLIRQGDSLFDPVGIHFDGAGAQGRPELVAELSALRREVVTATGSYKRSLVRRLRAAEARALVDSLDWAEARHRSEIADCMDQARAGDLFGQRRGLDRELGGRLTELRAGLRRLRQVRRRVRREAEVPWFHYQTHFADVFSRGGFDLIIGNPPWLRSEAIPAETRKQLRGRYRWWRAKGRCYGNSPDLAVAFVERALELAAPSGVVAMLIPAKIVTAGYGAAARHALASTTTLHTVADLTAGVGAEFDATVYPLALIASNRVPPEGHRVGTALGPVSGSALRQTELQGGGPWILVRSRVSRVFAKLRREHPRLGDSVIAHLGLKTGLNRVFLNPPEEVEPELLRWAIRGRDLKPFRCGRGLRLLWTHDAAGRPRRELPSRARAYLLSFENELRARRDFQGGPSWAVFRARTAVAPYRVVWADLARRLRAASLTTRRDLERIPLNSCYVAPLRTAAEADALAAWLNSTWVGATARHGAVPASGGFARFNAQVVARLPLPDSALSDARLTRLARAARSGKEVQGDLDAIVAQHLGLSSSAQSALRAAVVESAGHRR
jgi:adenine-specific DNA-methyltransferase